MTIFQPASTPAAGIVDIGNRKQHFLDNLLIDEASRVSHYMFRPNKHAGNPIIVADRPWEEGRDLGKTGDVQLVGQTVLYDEEENLFKMWYLPSALPDGRRPWCYATSTDGFHWQKPDLGLIEFEGSKQNNIVEMLRRGGDAGEANYYNVFKDHRDPDPQRRYKAQGEMHGPGGHQPPAVW